jgi:hypothetical protein
MPKTSFLESSLASSSEPSSTDAPHLFTMEEVYNDKNPYPNAPGYPSNKEANGRTRVSDKNEQQHVYDERGHIYSTDSSDNLLAAAGVRRIEAINEQFTTVDRWIVFFSVFLVAYCYGLDGTVRYTYQASIRSATAGGQR